MSKKLKTIAFDLGGVIFSENYLNTPIQPEMFHILDEFVK